MRKALLVVVARFCWAWARKHQHYGIAAFVQAKRSPPKRWWSGMARTEISTMFRFKLLVTAGKARCIAPSQGRRGSGRPPETWYATQPQPAAIREVTPA